MTGHWTRVLAVWCPDLSPNRAPDGCEPVVAAMVGFCPKVAVVGPRTCAIDARGPARHVGSERALARAVAAAVTARGYRCRVGIADGMLAAALAARVGAVLPAGTDEQFLTQQPIGVLADPDLASILGMPRPDPHMVETLDRVGIRTLGDVAALPADAVAARFGAAGRAAQRTTSGRGQRPVTAATPPADLSVAHLFDPPERSAEPVIFAACGLADRMTAGLAARGLSCGGVRIQVVCTDGREVTRLWWQDGPLSGLTLARRVGWQLDGWSPTSGDGDGGVTMLRLIPERVGPAVRRQPALWGGEAVDDRVDRAAARVRALLGHNAVLRPVLGGGRGPGDTVTLVPFGRPGYPRLPADRPWPGRLPPPAPAIVYPSPLPARVTDARGRPVTVDDRAGVVTAPAAVTTGGVSAPVVAWTGPWPIVERWWRPGIAVHKARFQFVTADGHAWLLAVRDGRWWVEARYD